MEKNLPAHKQLSAYLWACGGLADVKLGIGCRAAYTQFAKRRETNILFLTSAQSGCGARKTSCLYGLLAFVSFLFFPRFRLPHLLPVPRLMLL